MSACSITFLTLRRINLACPNGQHQQDEGDGERDQGAHIDDTLAQLGRRGRSDDAGEGPSAASLGPQVVSRLGLPPGPPHPGRR